MLRIVLYTKEACGLCDEVKQELNRLQAAYPHRLVEVDINQDVHTYETYWDIIPVVVIGDTRLQAPISRQDLEAALKANQA